MNITTTTKTTTTTTTIIYYNDDASADDHDHYDEDNDDGDVDVLGLGMGGIASVVEVGFVEKLYVLVRIAGMFANIVRRFWRFNVGEGCWTSARAFGA